MGGLSQDYPILANSQVSKVVHRYDPFREVVSEGPILLSIAVDCKIREKLMEQLGRWLDVRYSNIKLRQTKSIDGDILWTCRFPVQSATTHKLPAHFRWSTQCGSQYIANSNQRITVFIIQIIVTHIIKCLLLRYNGGVCPSESGVTMTN